MNDRQPILNIKNICLKYQKEKEFAINDLSLEIFEGEIIGILGQSGSGKSSLAKVICGLITPESGEVYLNQSLLCSNKKKIHQNQKKEIQIVFQDYNASFNPKMTVFDILSEPTKIHQKLLPCELKTKAINLLKLVNLSENFLYRYPHQMSGGQKQRLNFARSLALNPKVLICDEPISSLDFPIQNQILDLMTSLKEKKSLTIIFIGHDINSVAKISNRIAVMYSGEIIEVLSSDKILSNRAKHPYTKKLIQANSVLKDPSNSFLKDDVLIRDLKVHSNSCTFVNSCALVSDKCFNNKPKCTLKDNSHYVACHFYKDSNIEP